SWQSLSGPSGYEDLNNTAVAPYYSFDSTKRAIAALKLQVEEVTKAEMNKIAAAVKEVYITQEVGGEPKEPKTRKESFVKEEPKTREDFSKYFCQLTLDVNSVHPNLHLSEGNRTATMKSELKSYPEHPDRFVHWQQVLCRESLSSRCYWEVEWKGTETAFTPCSCVGGLVSRTVDRRQRSITYRPKRREKFDGSSPGEELKGQFCPGVACRSP
ncbi:hypothetical protein LDENG_00171790, partial [Lucifuga dentata]